MPWSPERPSCWRAAVWPAKPAAAMAARAAAATAAATKRSAARTTLAAVRASLPLLYCSNEALQWKAEIDAYSRDGHDWRCMYGVYGVRKW